MIDFGQSSTHKKTFLVFQNNVSPAMGYVRSTMSLKQPEMGKHCIEATNDLLAKYIRTFNYFCTTSELILRIYIHTYVCGRINDN